MTNQPPIQLIANLVVTDRPERGGRVLLVRYDPTPEGGTEPDHRWWLPGAELNPYEHPDEAAQRALADLTGLTPQSVSMTGVESFRGRRGWHLSFEYLVVAQGEASTDDEVPSAWFDPQQLPRTMHGSWERAVIERVSGSGLAAS